MPIQHESVVTNTVDEILQRKIILTQENLISKLQQDEKHEKDNNDQQDFIAFINMLRTKLLGILDAENTPNRYEPAQYQAAYANLIMLTKYWPLKPECPLSKKIPKEEDKLLLASGYVCSAENFKDWFINDNADATKLPPEMSKNIYERDKVSLIRHITDRNRYTARAGGTLFDGLLKGGAVLGAITGFVVGTVVGGPIGAIVGALSGVLFGLGLGMVISLGVLLYECITDHLNSRLQQKMDVIRSRPIQNKQPNIPQVSQNLALSSQQQITKSLESNPPVLVCIATQAPVPQSSTLNTPATPVSTPQVPSVNTVDISEQLAASMKH